MSANPEILFTTPRLTFRRIMDADLPLLESIFTDPGLMHYLGQPWTAAETRETLLEWQAEWGRDHYYYGILIERDTGQPVGAAGFTVDTHPDEPGLELAWFILPACQGRGYAAEMTAAVLRYAFTRTSVERVLAENHPDNAPAARVLQKTGFTCLGERRQVYDYLPAFDRQTLWQYIRSDWKDQPED